jgi:hypothetical protein
MADTVGRESATSINKLRTVTHRADGVASAATVTGVWLLIPFALGAVTQIVLGLLVLSISDDQDPSVPSGAWLAATLLLQTAYWAWMAYVSGRNPLVGLWALIPIVALIPTFSIARSVALRGGVGPAPIPDQVPVSH